MRRSEARPDAEAIRQRPPRAGGGRGTDVRLGVLEDFVGFYLRLAQDASFRAFARQTGQQGLKPGRFATMMVIHNNPGISQVALSRAIALDKSSVTPLIQEFLRQGLVARHQSKVDRRSFTLALTPTGEEQLRALEHHAAIHDRKIDRIVGRRKAEFIRLLKKLTDDLS